MRHNASTADRSFPEALNEMKELVTRRITLFLAYSVALIVVLAEIFGHSVPAIWEHGEKFLLPILLLVALVVIHQIIATSATAKKTQDDLRRVIERLKSESPDLLVLEDCVHDLQKTAVELGEIEEIEVDWLGLDMVHAWKDIQDIILQNEKIKRGRLRILMIDPAWKDTPPWTPEEVKAWRANAENSLALIERWYRDEYDDLLAGGRQIDLSVKTYSRLPVVHGFHIKKPFRTLYLSFCRWEGKKSANYGWGHKRYRQIRGDLLPAQLKDLEEIFVGQFEHLWHYEKTTRIPPPARIV
jgi:hypothetical protein